MTLAVLRCASCGVPLPIPSEAAARCAACGASASVPEQYVALHLHAESARATRRQAERVYRLLAATSLPPRAAERWGKFGIPGSVVGVPLFLYLTQDACGWQARTWVVFGVFSPLLLGSLLFAGLSARSDGVGYVQVIGGSIRPGAPLPSGQPTCGACGAPLAPEPDALSATCDYCLSDSWLESVSDAHVEGMARERANLADLVQAMKFRKFEFLLFLFLVALIPGGFLLWLWIGFSP
jgi:hypothetical protein